MTKKNKDKKEDVPRALTSEWWDYIGDPNLPESERATEIKRAVNETEAAEERRDLRRSSLTTDELNDEFERAERDTPDYPETIEEFYERVYMKNGLKDAKRRHDQAIEIRRHLSQSREKKP